MSYGIKHQIEASISANEKNIETLRAMLDVYGKLQPNGWTPDIYRQCVNELLRVQMCVVHRSLISDIFKIMEEMEDVLPDRRCPRIYDEGDAPFTRQDLERVRDALNNSLTGIPPS